VAFCQQPYTDNQFTFAGANATEDCCLVIACKYGMKFLHGLEVAIDVYQRTANLLVAADVLHATTSFTLDYFFV
jgi:hypothetical protein